MLAGLLFATADASDRHDMLAATLPVGGVTLIEFQARLLIAAGASQIVVMVSRLTPELLGAINRLGRRGVAVDAVRGPAEALAKLHPLARVLWLADGLVTTSVMVETMLKMPKPATSRMAPTTVYMMMLRMTKASRSDSFASCQATAL